MVSFVCNFTFEIEISAKMCDCIIIKLPGKEHKGLASSNLHFKIFLRPRKAIEALRQKKFG